MKKKKMIISIIILVIIIGSFLAVTGIKSYIKTVEKNLNRLAVLTITNVDLSKIPDGLYTGKHEVFPVAAEVRVIVKSNKITEIDLVKHKNGQGAGAEIIPSRVVESQTLDVDTVSGATLSSKAILKAIENALNTKALPRAD